MSVQTRLIWPPLGSNSCNVLNKRWDISEGLCSVELVAQLLPKWRKLGIEIWLTRGD
jgi:hypothetical protein